MTPGCSLINAVGLFPIVGSDIAMYEVIVPPRFTWSSLSCGATALTVTCSCKEPTVIWISNRLTELTLTSTLLRS